MSTIGNAESYIEVKGTVSVPDLITGKSAYEIALMNGFEGTEAEWLEFLADEATRKATEEADKAEAARIKAEQARDDAKQHTADRIDKWLDEHPEATTTVQDRSLTIDKMVLGTLGYVSPEMFGAVGDGVTDDTEAVRSALTCGFPSVVLKNKYFVSKQISVIGNKTITGGGTLFAPSAVSTEGESQTVLYFLREYGVEEVVIDGINFVTERNLEAPRSQGSGANPIVGGKCSRVHFITITGVPSVKISNVSFKNSDRDMAFYSCGNVIVDTFTSKDAYFVAFANNCENITIQNGNSVLYEYAGKLDHHYYLCAGNKRVLLSNLKMISTTVSSGEYPIHFNADDKEIATYGISEKAIIENCYVEASAFVAATCKDMTFVNTTFKQFEGAGSGVLYSQKGENTKFVNCSFDTVGDFNLTLLVRDNTFLFERCSFNNRFVLGSTTAKFVFSNCTFGNSIYTSTAGAWEARLYNCNIKKDSGYALSTYHSSDSTLEFYLCHFLANGDGIFSCRGEATIAFIKCYGDNEGSNKFLQYNSASATPTIRMYDCCFPTLKKRTSDTGTVWQEAGNVFSDTDFRTFHVGMNDPAASLGEDGDVYFKYL